MHVFISLSSGPLYFYEPSSSLSIGALKQRIAARTHIPEPCIERLVSRSTHHIYSSDQEELHSLSSSFEQLSISSSSATISSCPSSLSSTPSVPRADAHFALDVLFTLKGGKGGFGALLHSAKTRVGQRKDRNQGACRDLQGRRLRHVEWESRLREWSEKNSRLTDEERKKAFKTYLKDLRAIATNQYVKRVKCKFGEKCKYKDTTCRKWHPGQEQYQEDARKNRQKERDNTDRLKVSFGDRDRPFGDRIIDEKSIQEAVKSGLEKQQKEQEEEKEKERSMELESQKKRKLDALGLPADLLDDDDDDEEIDSTTNSDKAKAKEEPSQKKGKLELERKEADMKEAKVKENNESEKQQQQEDDDDDDEDYDLDEFDDDELCNLLPKIVTFFTEGAGSSKKSSSSNNNNNNASSTCVSSFSSSSLSSATSKSAKTNSPSSSDSLSSLSSSASSSSSTSSSSSNSSLSSSPAPASPPIDLHQFRSVKELESLGLEKLKAELTKHGLKCGGTLQERAKRLYLLKSRTVDQIPKSLLARKN
eukprot:TRINITY_DN89_c0_g4_i1.p1 TRINITY_DN89_c0_g4~~TRINITY_DN89_c0_g4_i1.p1  ORF type:complete len:535 (+),score=205.86 TRINITY_DN89_c0_g4_i1:87-1691(+)